ncbi:Hypothetical protein A7982_06366 [Minicystis rosea]|nr:Hypothetical protein A7982_06366 [Minicystis rosea]
MQIGNLLQPFCKRMLCIDFESAFDLTPGGPSAPLAAAGAIGGVFAAIVMMIVLIVCFPR